MTTKIMKFFKCIGTLLSLTLIVDAQEKPDLPPTNGDYLFMKITPKITQENGEPINDAEIHVAVGVPFQYKDGYNDFHGRSDEKGLFAVESVIQSNVKIEVKKSGYYLSKILYVPQNSQHLKSGEKIQPWNPTIPIMLKKIGKPIPMIVRNHWGKIAELPIMNENLGFDLVELDWLPPYGKGVRADMLVKAVRNEGDEKNYTANLAIDFPNKGDGVITLPKILGGESELKYPRIAPLNGYSGESLLKSLRHQEIIDESLPRTIEPFGYILRIRTEFDANGKVISALFGKIVDPGLTTDETRNPQRAKSPIYFASAPRAIEKNGVKSTGCYFSFSYYLNPTPNDQNLEFDMKNNLAPEAEWKDYPVP